MVERRSTGKRSSHQIVSESELNPPKKTLKMIEEEKRSKTKEYVESNLDKSRERIRRSKAPENDQIEPVPGDQKRKILLKRRDNIM